MSYSWVPTTPKSRRDHAEKSSAGKTAQNRSSEDCNPQDSSAQNRSPEDCNPQDSSAQNTRRAETQNARNQHADTVYYGAGADDVGGSPATGAGAGRRGLRDKV